MHDKIRKNTLLYSTIKIYVILFLSFYLPLYAFFIVAKNSYSIYGFLSLFLRWDTEWYLRIANEGYPIFKGIMQYGHLRYMWPPLYPLLLKILNLLFQDEVLTVFFLQNILLFGSIWVILNLFQQFINKRESFLLSLLFFVFPVSLFFFSGYSETLFILFEALFLYFLLKKDFFKASLVGLFLPLIRYQGIFFIFPFLWFMFEEVRVRKKSAWVLVWYSFIFVSGLCLWIGIVFLRTHSPLFFLSVSQSDLAFLEWGAFRGPFYTYIIQWFKRFIGVEKRSGIDRFQGIFVVAYIVMNYLTIRSRQVKIQTRLWGIFGIVWVIFPFFSKVESLWRYGYVYLPQFICFKNILNRSRIYEFLLIAFFLFRTIFALAFFIGIVVT